MNTPVNQETEHSNPRVSPVYLDDQHSESDSSSVTGILNDILTSVNKFNVEAILINIQDFYKIMSTTVNQLFEKCRKMERSVYSKLDTLSEQIPSKEPSENSTNKENDDRIDDLMNANSSLKHQVDILNSGIDNKNKKIKQLIVPKTTMNQKMLNREKAIGELKIQLGRKDTELKMLQEKVETNQVNKLKDESSVDFCQSLLKSLDKKNSENNENGNQDNSSTRESNKNTVHVIGDSLLQHIKPEWLLNNDIKETEKFRCVKHWAAKLSDCLPVLSKITHTKCIILHVGTNYLKNSSIDNMFNMMDQLLIRVIDDREH